MADERTDTSEDAMAIEHRRHDHPTDLISAAAGRAADAILRWQQADGSWRGKNQGGPMFTAATVACEAALGTLLPDDARLAEAALRSAQLPDGGLAPWPAANESNAEATLYLLAALRAVGVSASDPAMLAAARRLERLGGAKAAGPLAATIGALVGVVDARTLPRLPSATALLPGHDALVSRLLGVNALLPLRTLPFLWEALRTGPIGPQLGRRPTGLRARAARRLERYVRERQSPSGGLAGVPIFTLLGLLCLRLCGADGSDPAVLRGLAYVRRVYHRAPTGLEACLEIEPFESTHWDTAHMVRALARLPGLRHLDGARRGASFLVRAQSVEASPRDWQTPPEGAPDSGGWSWQPGNERNPDFDTTAEVLSALGELSRASGADRAALAEPIRRGVEWLLPFQNPDGGWAAFSHGKPRPPRGALYLRGRGLRHRVRSWVAENGDPSTADIVGRVLYGLAACLPSLRPDHPSVRAAAAFLADHQLPETGGWWGRWAINHLAGTAYAVTGLARAGLDVRAPWIARGLDFLVAHQNDDGGWGESEDSYRDLALAGKGESTIALTGLVCWALQVCGRRDHPAVARGLAHLMARQAADGSFRDTRCYSTMFPLRAYWLNDTYPTFFALEALLGR